MKFLKHTCNVRTTSSKSEKATDSWHSEDTSGISKPPVDVDVMVFKSTSRAYRNKRGGRNTCAAGGAFHDGDEFGNRQGFWRDIEAIQALLFNGLAYDEWLQREIVWASRVRRIDTVHWLSLA